MAYVMNLEDFKSVGTHWIALHVNAISTVYFGSFGVENFPKEINEVIWNKIVTTNIHRIQAYSSIMCGYFCIGVVDSMLKGKSILQYINLFSPNDYEKNYKIMLKYSQ